MATCSGRLALYFEALLPEVRYAQGVSTSYKESNSNGAKLIYYKTGGIDDANANVYLKNETSGNIVTAKSTGTFLEPKYYYRPVPKQQTVLNPKLLPQLFGWE